MSTSKILIYAELLSNIRQVSIIAALETPCDSSTAATLSSDRKTISLSHGGQTALLDLPGQIAPGYQLQKPAVGVRELSWRLPVSGPVTRASLEDAQSNDAPWSSTSLGEDTEICCRGCGSVLVRKGTVATWKDLPSDNWAEMMDFWHCHKPHSHPGDTVVGTETNFLDNEKVKANSGYGANTRFIATPQTGFIDLTTFLLAPADCSGVQTNNTTDDDHLDTLNCSSCKGYVGYIDHQTEGYRLWKWRLSIQVPNSWATAQTHWQTSPSISLLISSQLCSIMQAQCSSRCIILPQKSFETRQRKSCTDHIGSQATSTFSQSSSASPSMQHPASPSSSLSPAVSRSISLPSYGSTAGSPYTSYLDIWVLAQSLRFSSTTTFSRGGLSTTSSEDMPMAYKCLSDQLLTAKRSEMELSRDCVLKRTNGKKHYFDYTYVKNGKDADVSGIADSILSSDPGGTFAMKIFWKVISRDEAMASLEKNNIEEMELPAEAIQDIEQVLRESASLLPPSARKFREWDVGLLERYEER